MNKKVTVKVVSIDEITASNPTMTMSRNVPMSFASLSFKAIFEMIDTEGEMTFHLSNHQAEKLIPGMRGTLTYRGEKFISFDANTSDD